MSDISLMCDKCGHPQYDCMCEPAEDMTAREFAMRAQMDNLKVMRRIADAAESLAERCNKQDEQIDRLIDIMRRMLDTMGRISAFR